MFGLYTRYSLPQNYRHTKIRIRIYDFWNQLYKLEKQANPRENPVRIIWNCNNQIYLYFFVHTLRIFERANVALEQTRNIVSMLSSNALFVVDFAFIRECQMILRCHLFLLLNICLLTEEESMKWNDKSYWLTLNSEFCAWAKNTKDHERNIIFRLEKNATPSITHLANRSSGFFRSINGIHLNFTVVFDLSVFFVR